MADTLAKWEKARLKRLDKMVPANPLIAHMEAKERKSTREPDRPAIQMVRKITGD